MYLICQIPPHFLFASTFILSNFSQMFIVLGMYNFVSYLSWHLDTRRRFWCRKGHLEQWDNFVSEVVVFLFLFLKVSKSRKQNTKSRILPKNERNTFRIVSWVSFVRFLEESETPYFAFEIYWPLIMHCCR